MPPVYKIRIDFLDYVVVFCSCRFTRIDFTLNISKKFCANVKETAGPSASVTLRGK